MATPFQSPALQQPTPLPNRTELHLNLSSRSLVAGGLTQTRPTQRLTQIAFSSFCSNTLNEKLAHPHFLPISTTSGLLCEPTEKLGCMLCLLLYIIFFPFLAQLMEFSTALQVCTRLFLLFTISGRPNDHGKEKREKNPHQTITLGSLITAPIKAWTWVTGTETGLL